MSISVFKFGSQNDTSIRLPSDRNLGNHWNPKLNDRFPDFMAKTTKGRIKFSDWRKGSWVLLVSHPAAFTPVCTTEISALAKRASEFEERHVKIIALTGDPLERVQPWTAEIERQNEISVTFPHIADDKGIIAHGCGLVSHEPLSDGKFCARRTVLIDPNGVVRMILDYPLAVGRSVDETLRSIDALILSERLDAFAPSDWQLGEPLLLTADMALSEGKLRHGMNGAKETAYFRVLDLSENGKAGQIPQKKKRLSTIDPIELRRIVHEHNLRTKTEPDADARKLRGIFVPSLSITSAPSVE